MNMKTNNGWYSVFDTEHRPESGTEYLCLALLDYAYKEKNPLADPGTRVYFVATWHNKGDIVRDEIPDPADYKSEEELLFGKPRRVERDGFYIQTPHACESKAFVKEFNGVKLDKYTVYYTWERLGCHGEIPDGLMAWKELDVPEEKNSCKD